jgi:hypothetical protein
MHGRGYVRTAAQHWNCIVTGMFLLFVQHLNAYAQPHPGELNNFQGIHNPGWREPSLCVRIPLLAAYEDSFWLLPRCSHRSHMEITH